MKGCITKSRGLSYYRIKPYPLFIADVWASQGCITQFIAYTKFTMDFKTEEVSVNEDSVHQFNPEDVTITDELKKMLDNRGISLSFLMAERYENAQKGLNVSDDKVVRRYKEQGIMVTEVSECPSFKKAWDETAAECIACKKEFPDEYAACKRVCLTKGESNQSSVVTPDPGKDTSDSKEPESHSEIKSVQVFRQGSRADVLYKYIQTDKRTFEEAANYVAQVCNCSVQKALENTRGYISDFKRGRWGEKKLPFHVKVEDNHIIFCEGVKE